MFAVPLPNSPPGKFWMSGRSYIWERSEQWARMKKSQCLLLFKCVSLEREKTRRQVQGSHRRLNPGSKENLKQDRMGQQSKPSEGLRRGSYCLCARTHIANVVKSSKQKLSLVQGGGPMCSNAFVRAESDQIQGPDISICVSPSLYTIEDFSHIRTLLHYRQHSSPSGHPL